jgi:hypothetical protein
MDRAMNKVRQKELAVIDPDESKVGWLQLAAKWQSMAAEAHPPGQQAQQPQLEKRGIAFIASLPGSPLDRREPHP